MSAKSVRKCKACNHAVKGHSGPYGLGKCTVVWQRDNNENLDKIEEEVSKPSRKVEAVQELQEDVEVLGDMITVAVAAPDSRKEIVKLPSTSKETGNVLSDMSKEVNESVGEIIGLIDVDDSLNESDVDEESHFLEETDKTDEIVDDQVQTKTNDDTEDAGSYVEPSLFLGDSTVEEEEEDRKRLMSVSDSDIDIRRLLMGRSFALCRCDNADCNCEGEVEFRENTLEGEVTDLYLDPIDNETDFKPTLKLAKAGWKKAEPNVVRLTMGGITAPGVVSSTGKLVLTASRVVELVKGRREMSTDLRGSLTLQLKFSSFYTKQGVRTPLKYKDIECVLYMLEKVEDEVWEDEDSSKRWRESEDSGEDED